MGDFINIVRAATAWNPPQLPFISFAAVCKEIKSRSGVVDKDLVEDLIKRLERESLGKAHYDGQGILIGVSLL